MNKLIKTKVEYEDALKRIDALMDIDAPTSGQIDELELLAHLVEQYEEKEFPMDIPSPIAAIKFKMEQLNLKQGDLIPFIGSKSHGSGLLTDFLASSLLRLCFGPPPAPPLLLASFSLQIPRQMRNLPCFVRASI